MERMVVKASIDGGPELTIRISEWTAITDPAPEVPGTDFYAGYRTDPSAVLDSIPLLADTAGRALRELVLRHAVIAVTASKSPPKEV
jgi:hypothetical protein